MQLASGAKGHDHWDINLSLYIEASLVCVLLVDSCLKGIRAEIQLMN